MSAPIWNKEFELPDGPYPVSDIQDYFKYILKNIEKRHWNNPSVKINKITEEITEVYSLVYIYS